MTSKNMLVLGLFLFTVAALPAEESQEESASRSASSLALYLASGLEIPIGESFQYYLPGGTAIIGVEYGFPKRPVFLLFAGAGYSLEPIRAQESISVLSGGVGLGLGYGLTNRFSARASVEGGYYYSFFNSSEEITGNNPYAAAGIGLRFLVSPSLSLDLGGFYKNHFGLYQGITASLAALYHLTGRDARKAQIESSLPLRPGDLKNPKAPEPGKALRVDSIELQQLFPIFYKHYDDHPIGSLTLSNSGDEPVTDLSITLLISDYMAAPKQCAAPAKIPAKTTQTVDLYALFTEKVLEITEGTKVAVELGLLYRMKGDWYQDSRIETVRMYDRNAMTWDDDRRAAAFVTAKDPMVLSFAKNVTGIVRDRIRLVVNENMLKALSLHEALCLRNLAYIVDPRTPYAQYSASATQVDFLQFPRQTLEYGAGDCDDLSILYCALLEAIGVETAFITVPGHIFIALCLDLAAERAARDFPDSGELIFQGGKTWMPIEVTQRTGGFLKAWEIGALQWRDHLRGGLAAFIPVHESWGVYEPVGLPGGKSEATLPGRELLLSSCQREVDGFIQKQIGPQVAALRRQIETSPGAVPRNKLGVLYARYGLTGEARAEFEAILRQEEYLPALLNLGNLHFQSEDFPKALEYFERAAKISVENPTVVLWLARVHHRLENYGLAKSNYEKVKQLDPKLAGRFTYLELKSQEGVRAASSERAGGEDLWQD